jgi:hypothetical protein
MQAFSASEIGELHLNQKQLNQLFNRTDLVLSSGALANQMPVFKEKLGDNTQLKMVMSFADFNV